MPKKAGEPNEPETTPPSVSVVVTEPEGNAQAQAANAEALEQIAQRIEALETRITQAVESERQWTTQQITSLTTEAADLKANLQTITQGLTPQVTELKEQLTLLSSSLSELKTRQTEPPPNQPIPEPPPSPESVADTLEIAPAPSVQQSEPDKSQRPRKRVI
jgi:uncharacterized phage infection (PIP) family protein YhgE